MHSYLISFRIEGTQVESVMGVYGGWETAQEKAKRALMRIYTGIWNTQVTFLLPPNHMGAGV